MYANAIIQIVGRMGNLFRYDGFLACVGMMLLYAIVCIIYKICKIG